jgi:hypothetical protein
VVTSALDGDGDAGIVLLREVCEPGLARMVNERRVMDFARGGCIDFLQPRCLGGLHLVCEFAPLFFAAKHAKADLHNTLLLGFFVDGCILNRGTPTRYELIRLMQTRCKSVSRQEL